MRSQETITKQLSDGYEKYVRTFGALLAQQPFDHASWSGNGLVLPQRLITLHAFNRSMIIQTYARIHAYDKTLPGEHMQIVQNESRYSFQANEDTYCTELLVTNATGNTIEIWSKKPASRLDFRMMQGVLQTMIDSPYPLVSW